MILIAPTKAIRFRKSVLDQNTGDQLFTKPTGKVHLLATPSIALEHILEGGLEETVCNLLVHGSHENSFDVLNISDLHPSEICQKCIKAFDVEVNSEIQ